MKILFLSPHKHLIDFLESYGDDVIQTIDKINDEILEEIDFIISYGYRHKISKEVIEKVNGNAVNLHISYLPYNRGADPNLWSFLENTPKGVTIHFIDEGIDTGDIISQLRINYDDDDTLATTYKRLKDTIERLFKSTWFDIREGKAIRKPQYSYHKSKDKEKYNHLLKKGWQTAIKDIIGGAKCQK